MRPPSVCRRPRPPLAVILGLVSDICCGAATADARDKTGQHEKAGASARGDLYKLSHGLPEFSTSPPEYDNIPICHPVMA